MKEAAQKLYEQFCNETMPNRYMLPWSELPNHIQQAWVNVLKAAKEMEILDEV